MYDPTSFVQSSLIVVHGSMVVGEKATLFQALSTATGTDSIVELHISDTQQ